MPPPNLLFIFTDQQRYDTLAAYGNNRIEMPNLNRLAETSTVFEHAYVSEPICTPSRSTLLTGLCPHTNGCTANNIPLSESVPCLPEMLEGSDYVTAYHGKWHLGDEIFAQRGFQQWRSIEDGYWSCYSKGRDPGARSSYHHWLVGKGLAPRDGERFARDRTARLTEELGKPAYLAYEASRFIRENKNAPFVLFVNFLEPHTPLFGPRDGQYNAEDVELPGNFNCPPGPDQPLKARILRAMFREWVYEDFDLKTEEGWRGLISNYWGLCSLVDTHVGTILATLEECGITDRTIVVYTSDHGAMMGSHQLMTKSVMFEEAVRVPLLLHLPGQRRQARIGGPVSQVDMVPTLLDLMGQRIPDHLDGKSLKQVLEGGEGRVRDDVLIEWNPPLSRWVDSFVSNFDRPEIAAPQQVRDAFNDPVRTVITEEGWKLNCSPLGEHELYNLNEDPLETSNLATQQGMRPLMRGLSERILAWQERTRDTVALPDL